MNSPRSGVSSTLNVTSRITVKLPNVFVTLRNSTMQGTPTSVLGHPIRKQAALQPEQESIDAKSQQADDDEDENNVFRKRSALACHQQVAEPVLGVDEFGQHDVAERHAEQVAEAVVDVGKRQCHKYLRHDLVWRGAKRLRRLHVAVGYARNRPDRVRVHERYAGDEDEHHLLRFVD